MIFLINYDRANGKIITLEEFKESNRKQAEDRRYNLELSLIEKQNNNEICLLEADNKEALLLTHRRYFETLSEITATGSSFVKSME